MLYNMINYIYIYIKFNFKQQKHSAGEITLCIIIDIIKFCSGAILSCGSYISHGVPY